MVESNNNNLLKIAANDASYSVIDRPEYNRDFHDLNIGGSMNADFDTGNGSLGRRNRNDRDAPSDNNNNNKRKSLNKRKKSGRGKFNNLASPSSPSPVSSPTPMSGAISEDVGSYNFDFGNEEEEEVVETPEATTFVFGQTDTDVSVDLTGGAVLYAIAKSGIDKQSAKELVKILSAMPVNCRSDIVRVLSWNAKQPIVQPNYKLVDKAYPHGSDWTSLEQSLGMRKKKEIKDIITLYKFIRNTVIAYCDYKDGAYWKGNVCIMKIGNYYGDFKFPDESILFLSDRYKLSFANYVHHARDIYDLTVFLTNGNFSEQNGKMIYRLQSLAVAKKPDVGRFYIPGNVAKARSWLADVMKALNGPYSLDTVMKVIRTDKVKHMLDSYREGVRKAMQDFYKDMMSKEFRLKNVKTIIKFLMAFSSENKRWRSSVQTDANLLPTPEFDHVVAGYNYYPRKVRNKVMYDGYIKSNVIKDEAMYDCSTVSIGDIEVLQYCKAIRISWTENVKSVQKFCTSLCNVGVKSISIRYFQKHSLEADVVCSKDGTGGVKDMMKSMFVFGVQVWLGELQYMNNMVTGDFGLTGNYNVPVTIPEKYRSVDKDSFLDDLNIKDGDLNF